VFFAGLAKPPLKIYKSGADDTVARINLTVRREVNSGGSWIDNEAVVHKYVANGVFT
jgi:hypothetical protein